MPTMKLLVSVLFSLIIQIFCQSHPWIGEPRNETWWTPRHPALLQQTAAHKADVQVVFLGDSITQGWEGNGKEIWDKYYAPRHAYNYGSSGDRTEQVIWRIENKELDGVMAKLVVLKIGKNLLILIFLNITNYLN